MEWITKPAVSPNLMYLLLIGALFAIQFIPLIFELHLRQSEITTSLQSVDAKVVAGFGIGVLVLILTDLIADAFQRQCEFWLSRSGYFWLPLFQCLLILVFSSFDRIAAIYLTYSAAVVVFYYGRAFFDLCRFDTTHTWTSSKTILLLIILALGFLTINFDLHFGTEDSHILSYVGVGLMYLFDICITINLALCIYRLFNKYKSKTISGRFNCFAHEETIVVSICIILGLCTFGFFISPLASVGSSNDTRDVIPLNIVGDILIRSIMACSLALIPSILLKRKALFLQQDLDLKSLFVRNVSHEIRTPLNIAVVGLDILRRTRLKSNDRNPEEEEMLDEIIDSCKGTHNLV